MSRRSPKKAPKGPGSPKEPPTPRVEFIARADHGDMPRPTLPFCSADTTGVPPLRRQSQRYSRDAMEEEAKMKSAQEAKKNGASKAKRDTARLMEQAQERERKHQEVIARKAAMQMQEEEHGAGPDATPAVRPNQETICILRGVPGTVRPADLRQMLESFGGVASLRMIKTTGTSAVSIMVQYESVLVARKALQNLAPWLVSAATHLQEEISNQSPSRVAQLRSRAEAKAKAKAKAKKQESSLSKGSFAGVWQQKTPHQQTTTSRGTFMTTRTATPKTNKDQLMNLVEKGHTLNTAHRHSEHHLPSIASVATAMRAGYEVRKRLKESRSQVQVKNTTIPGNETIGNLTQAWYEMDAQRNGYLDSIRVRLLVQQLRARFAAEYTGEFSMDRAMKQMDDDGSGFVTFLEFETWWRGSGGGTKGMAYKMKKKVKKKQQRLSKGASPTRSKKKRRQQRSGDYMPAEVLAHPAIGHRWSLANDLSSTSLPHLHAHPGRAPGTAGPVKRANARRSEQLRIRPSQVISFERNPSGHDAGRSQSCDPMGRSTSMGGGLSELSRRDLLDFEKKLGCGHPFLQTSAEEFVFDRDASSEEDERNIELQRTRSKFSTGPRKQTKSV